MRRIMVAVALVLVVGGALGGGAPAAADSGSPLAVAAAAWAWPVPPPHPVVRGFEAPATPYAAGHRGIDVTAAVGTEVTAPDDGVVVYAGVLADRGVLSIDHGGGVLSSFEPVTATVHAGDHIVRGEVVATVSTGGTHPAGVLHIGARVDGGYVSPLLFLGGVAQPVLLPVP